MNYIYLVVCKYFPKGKSEVHAIVIYVLFSILSKNKRFLYSGIA